VEDLFMLRGIIEEPSRFYNTLGALSEATVVLVANLVEDIPLPAMPFTDAY
jgi:hypothetical protein